MRILKTKKGFSAVEMAAVIILVLAVLIGFGGYIERGLAGRWKSVGDTFGQGRHYDPRGFGSVGESGGTQDCFFDQDTGRWVDENLYRHNNCDCTLIRGDGNPLPEYATLCTGCKASSVCANPPP